MDIMNILTVTLVLFAIIDVPGAIPVLISIRAKTGSIHAEQATLFSAFLMVSFLFVGHAILNLIGLDVASFSLAGALVIFIIGLEMILGIEIFKPDNSASASSIVPVAFPLIAGSGTLTTILSLKAEYENAEIIVAILLNLLVVYVVLKYLPTIERFLGPGGIGILRKIFGIILISIAIKLFSNNIYQLIEQLSTPTP